MHIVVELSEYQKIFYEFGNSRERLSNSIQLDSER